MLLRNMARISNLLCLGILLLFLGTHDVEAADNGTPKMLTSKDIVNYLIRYGYLASKISRAQHSFFSAVANTSNVTSQNTTRTEMQATTPYSDQEIQRALLDFQDYMSLPRTGTFDSNTQRLMQLSRCGVRDKSPHAPWIPHGLQNTVHRRRRRYALQGSKWPQPVVTYTIAQPTVKLPTSVQNQTIWEALRRWSEVSPLVFRWHPLASSADITVRFVSGDHGDGQPFDGKGNVLGHAFYPSYGGEVHFDDDETWLIGQGPTSNGNILLRVAIHEIGHALGVDHSSHPAAIMNAIYRNGNAVTAELQDDDVAAVQSIYGMCETSFDSVFSWMGNGKTYAFKNDVYWSYNDAAGRTDHGYPRALQDYWRGVPERVDEAFMWGHNYKTYFFKGSNYYKFNDALDRVEDGYPQQISNGWPGIPDNIDAAFTWSDRISYFFKGDLCYKFDNANDTVHTGFPKNISDVWPGIPNNIDTAFRYYWDAKTYFFKGFYFWKWDDHLKKAMGPLQTKHGWRNHCFV